MKILIILMAVFLTACQSTATKRNAEPTAAEIARAEELKKEIQILKDGGICTDFYTFAHKDVVYNSSMVERKINGDRVYLLNDGDVITVYFNSSSILQFDTKKSPTTITNDNKFIFALYPDGDFAVGRFNKPTETEMINGCNSSRISSERIKEYKSNNLL